MNVQAFLNRIGLEGPIAPNLEGLKTLIRSHLETVPFENLDFCRNPREMSLEEEDLFNKVVTRRRGGVCFELNGLMNRLLGELGFERYPVSVRITTTAGANAPVNHQGNVVVLDGEQYYCDVGFGGPGPKGVLCITDPKEQDIAGERFRVELDGVNCRIYRWGDEGWIWILAFTNIPANLADYKYILYYYTANPASPFVTRRTVNLTTPTGSLALTEMTFTKRDGDTTLRRELADEEEVRQVLKEEFGIEL